MDLHAHNRSCFDGCAIDFACLPQSDKAVRLLNYMRQLAFFFFFLATSTLCSRARVHEMEFDQARQIALIVARHDNITVDDRTIVMNSMDTRTDAGFIRGYYSFSIIRESDSPAHPDEKWYGNCTLLSRPDRTGSIPPAFRSELDQPLEKGSVPC